jgi:hypothetical protein
MFYPQYVLPAIFFTRDILCPKYVLPTIAQNEKDGPHLRIVIAIPPLPAALKKLIFGHAFNQPLVACVVPPTLGLLTFERESFPGDLYSPRKPLSLSLSLSQREGTQ